MACLYAQSTNRNDRVLEIRQLVALAAALMRLKASGEVALEKMCISRSSSGRLLASELSPSEELPSFSTSEDNESDEESESEDSDSDARAFPLLPPGFPPTFSLFFPDKVLPVSMWYSTKSISTSF